MKGLALFLVSLAVPVDAAELPAPASAEAPQTIAARDDAAQRMTVPVTIGGSRAYRFVVDTGSDRTVIARAIADELKLPQGPAATLHSMAGVSQIQTVRLGALTVGGREVPELHAPALEQANLGAEGLLGIDSLAGRRIVMDFVRRTMTVLAAGERERVEAGTIVVTARSRYGQLVLVDADVDGTPVTVIIDSGAQSTVGNAALRRLLGKRNRKLEFFKTDLIDVTGARLPAEVAGIGRVRLGGLRVENVVVAFADAHPFARFGLSERPAMLLGMDTLRAFKRVSVDFAQRKVRFLPPDGA